MLMSEKYTKKESKNHRLYRTNFKAFSEFV